MHIVIIFINIGSYHAARLKATYEMCQKLNWQFTAIQVTDDTLEHSWGNFGSNSAFPVKTLLTTKSSNNTKKDAFSAVACEALKNCLLEIKPNIVFIPGWSFAVARTALKWCQKNRVAPILMSDSNEHDAPRIWWKERYKSWIVNQYQAGLVGGISSQQYLIKLGMKSEAIFSGYDVVDNNFFNPQHLKNLPKNHHKPYFLAIARFVPKKNLLFLLTAYAEYRSQFGNNSWDLILCGDGRLAPQIKAKIKELNLQDAVYLPGFLKPQELLPYFAHASCFIHTSIREQWGLVINEAMAAGLPVLVSNRCGCYPDLIVESINGFGFDPEDSTQLTNLMLTVSSPEFDLKSMSQSALKQIQKFSTEHFSQSVVKAVRHSLKVSQSTKMNYLSRTKSKIVHEYHRFRSYIGRPKMVIQTKPVILSNTDICDRPIFLIGVHRSGTSLCRRIIDSHSNIACPPETFYLEHFASMIRDRNTWAGFHGMGFDPESALEEIKKWSTQYHEAYRIALGKPRWADKTPQYVAILPEIKQLFGSKAQYIMIFRHPLDVVYSIFKRGWRFGDFDPDLLTNTAMYVSHSVKKQLAFIKKYPDLCFCLHYEHLIDNPENTLKAVFEFLDEPWEEKVLHYNDLPHSFGTEDPVVRGTKGFISNFDNWKALTQVQLSTISPILEEIIDELGYSVDKIESTSDSQLLPL